MTPEPAPQGNTGRTRTSSLRRTLLVTGLLIAFATVMGGGVGVAGNGNTLLRTLGDETLIPNVQVKANLKFSPGKLRIASGETLTIEHADKTAAPHTLTIVEPEELPQTFEDLFEGDCSTCDAAAAAHLSTDPPTLLVDGGDGFNDVGDSILFFHGQTVEIGITAMPGETLSFMCIIHPWMQGAINVT